MFKINPANRWTGCSTSNITRNELKASFAKNSPSIYTLSYRKWLITIERNSAMFYNKIGWKKILAKFNLLRWPNSWSWIKNQFACLFLTCLSECVNVCSRTVRSSVTKRQQYMVDFQINMWFHAINPRIWLFVTDATAKLRRAPSKEAMSIANSDRY